MTVKQLAGVFLYPRAGTSSFPICLGQSQRTAGIDHLGASTSKSADPIMTGDGPLQSHTLVALFGMQPLTPNAICTGSIQGQQN